MRSLVFQIQKILIASHIKRWSDCNEEERLDVNNGILLSPTFDSLFDKHLISFSDEGEILINTEEIGLGNMLKLGFTSFGSPYFYHQSNYDKEKIKKIKNKC